jgi:hypothetical protein
MSEEIKFILRVIGSLVLLLWLLALLRKMYYGPTSEARFLLGFILAVLGGKLIALWIDTHLYPEADNLFSVSFGNLIYLVPAWFYYQCGSKDKQVAQTRELSELDRRAHAALEVSNARLQ